MVGGKGTLSLPSPSKAPKDSGEATSLMMPSMRGVQAGSGPSPRSPSEASALNAATRAARANRAIVAGALSLRGGGAGEVQR